MIFYFSLYIYIYILYYTDIDGLKGRLVYYITLHYIMLEELLLTILSSNTTLQVTLAAHVVLHYTTDHTHLPM